MLERGSVLLITLALLKPCRSMAGQAPPWRRSLWCHPSAVAAQEKGLLRGHQYPSRGGVCSQQGAGDLPVCG